MSLGNEGTLAGAWSERLSRAVQGKGEGKEVDNALSRASEKTDHLVRSTYDKAASKVEHAKDKIHGAGHSAKQCVPSFTKIPYNV